MGGSRQPARLLVALICLSACGQNPDGGSGSAKPDQSASRPTLSVSPTSSSWTDHEAGAHSPCPTLQDTAEIIGVSARVERPTHPIQISMDGTFLTLELLLTNITSEKISFGSGPAYGVIQDSLGQVVNATSAETPSVGIDVVLEPGETMKLPLILGTQRCDDGAIAPGGTYTLVGVFQHADGEVTRARSEPITVLVDLQAG